MASCSAHASRITTHLHGFAHGGDAVGRLPDGRACFVGYGIPGETVVAEVTDERKRFARATAVEVLEPSAHRVVPPCPHFGPNRCGGCRLQHIDPSHQAALLRQVVVDQLERIGKLSDPPVTETLRPHPGDGFGYRNSARMAPDAAGRLGFRRTGSHDLEPVEMCPLLDPPAAAARTAAGDGWAGVDEVVIRGDAEGRALLEIHAGSAGLPPLPEAELPAVVVGRTGPVTLRGRPGLVEHVAGRSFTVSPTSFFQSSRAAAGLLAELVGEGAAVQPGHSVLDLYAGVGVFSATLAEAGGMVTAVEADTSAAHDAASNLTDLDVEVLEGRAEHVIEDLAFEGRRADVVVADPPRRGIGPAMAEQVARIARRRVVYVACDAAALARDAGVLASAGWRLLRAVPVDQFTHTGHVEVVATFVPANTDPPGEGSL